MKRRDVLSSASAVALSLPELFDPEPAEAAAGARFFRGTFSGVVFNNWRLGIGVVGTTARGSLVSPAGFGARANALNLLGTFSRNVLEMRVFNADPPNFTTSIGTLSGRFARGILSGELRAGPPNVTFTSRPQTLAGGKIPGGSYTVIVADRSTGIDVGTAAGKVTGNTFTFRDVVSLRPEVFNPPAGITGKGFLGATRAGDFFGFVDGLERLIPDPAPTGGVSALGGNACCTSVVSLLTCGVISLPSRGPVALAPPGEIFLETFTPDYEARLTRTGR